MTHSHDLALFSQILQAISLVDDRMHDVPHGSELTPTVADAVLWRLSVIGQVTELLSEEARAGHPEVDWGGLKRLQQIATGSLGGLTRDEVWLTVDVALPALRAFAAAEVEAANLPEQARTPGQSLVLLVDDDPDIRRILDLLLTHAGYTVLEAADGEEALALADQSHPDAVISDVQIPKIDGIQLVGRMRQVAGLERVPILLFTGKPPGHDLDAVLSRDRVRYMSKGDPGKVIRALAEMLEHDVVAPGGATRL